MRARIDDSTPGEGARNGARPPVQRYWLPIGFVIASLLALAIVPPIWQARIEEGRRTISARLEPARDEVIRMLVAFGREVALVRSFIATGDVAWLDELEESPLVVPQSLARIRALTGEGMPAVAAAVDSAEQAYRSWRANARTLHTIGAPPHDATGWLQGATERTNQTYAAMDRLREALVETQNAIRMRSSEMGRIGVLVTVGLALLSLASVILVVGIGRRLTRLVVLERSARARAETRAREERALRDAIGAVATTYTVPEVIERIAEAAVLATGANAALVTRIHLDRNELEVVAASGESVSGVGQRMHYPGSFAERAVERNAPELTDALRNWRRQLPGEIVDTCPDCPALLVPLVNAGEAVGTLVILGSPGGAPFRLDQVDRAHAFANLAAIAIRKVHMFEDSEQRREALVRVTESRARLVRGFSHDVKNPLGAADGYLQLLMSDVFGETTPTQKEALGNARRSLRDAMRLIDNLLALARAETPEVEVQREPTDVGAAAREMAEEYRAQAEAKGLAVEIDTPPTLPLIESDASRIRQVLGNLLSNAVKFTERGRISVRVREVTGDCNDGNPCVQVEVSDTGPGIPPEKQEIIFDEFARADAGGPPGTGVGLAISRRICEALGGTLTVESEPGRGSTFRFTLPALRPRDDAAAASAA